MPTARAAQYLLFTALIAALVLLPALIGGRYVPTIAISILLFFILGALFDLMLGFLNIVNFGVAGFLAAGAYGAGLATYQAGLSPWLGLFVGAVASLALGLLSGLLTLRLRGVYVGLTTLFVMETLRFGISNARGLTRGASGLTVDPFPPLLGIGFSRNEPLHYYYLLLALVGVAYLCLHLLVRSRVGLVFKAIRDDDLGTSVLGLDVVRFKLLNFAVASFFLGLFGAFYAYYIGILVPTPQEFGIPRTVEILTIAYVGGRGTLWGSLLGALALVGVQEVFRDLDQWRLIIYGVLLMAVIVAFPGGLAAAVQNAAQVIRTRLARLQAPSPVRTG